MHATSLWKQVVKKIPGNWADNFYRINSNIQALCDYYNFKRQPKARLKSGVDSVKPNDKLRLILDEVLM